MWYIQQQLRDPIWRRRLFPSVAVVDLSMFLYYTLCMLQLRLIILYRIIVTVVVTIIAIVIAIVCRG